MSLHIIIPVYNTETYIDRCFNSLIVEDSKYIKKYDISVLFVNDGSTDNSQMIINELQSKYNFVESITQENGGLSVARNTGIKHIQSKHYALLDSDDWLDMPKFCEVYKRMLEEKLDVIAFGLSYYNDNNEFTGHRANQNVEYNKICTGIDFLEQGYQPSSACLFIYDRDFIVKNKLWYFLGITQEDVEHTFRMMLAVKSAMFLETKVYKYFRRSDSDTMTRSKKRLEKYLSDSIIVAQQIAKNKETAQVKNSKKLLLLTEKTYNSVVWNLLWRFLSKPEELDTAFKLNCIKDLKEKKIYPIKGALKTKFQRQTRIIMNIQPILSLLLKR